MTSTPHLNLPWMAAGQAQKHVTFNEALRALDAIVQLGVKNRNLGMPPESPANGDRHIVASPASGAWSGQEGNIAAWQDGAWAFHTPSEGWLAWVEEENLLLAHAGGEWIMATAGAHQNLGMLGIGTAADASNRLSVKSDSVLFSHENADIRAKLNKQSQTGTASVLFQTGWSGRAEMGLTGDDRFHIKISADGAVWKEALVVESSGAVSMPRTVPAASPFNLVNDAGRFAGNPEPKGVLAPVFSAPDYLIGANGATISQGPGFIHDNTTYGGSRGNLEPVVDALISRLRDPDSRRYGVEFHLLDITAGNGESVARTFGGETFYLGFSNPAIPLPNQLTMNFWVHAIQGKLLAYKTSSNSRLFIDGYERVSPQVITPADGWTQITKLIDRDPAGFAGYNNISHELFCLPGTRYHLACWLVTPGHAPTGHGELYGIVPSLTCWN